MTSRAVRLERIARGGETDRVECKSELNISNADGKATLVKRLIGLANAHSGLSYVVLGADDNGNATGHDHSDLTHERLQQIVQALCEPYLPTTPEHLQVDGNPVCVIEIAPRRGDLPYRAANTAGQGPILKRGYVYYRYGRHTTEALYPELNRLIRTPRPSGRHAPDDYQYMSPDQRLEAMTGDLNTAFRLNKITPRDKTYRLLFIDFGSGRRAWPTRTYPTVNLAVGGREFVIPMIVEPIPLRANFLERSPMRAMAESRPTRRDLLQLLVAHGTVGQPLSTPWRRTIMERVEFGWYVGPTPDLHHEMDGILIFENARTRSGMEQIVAAAMDWMAGPGQTVMLRTDVPGG